MYILHWWGKAFHYYSHIFFHIATTQAEAFVGSFGCWCLRTNKKDQQFGWM